MRFFLAAAKSAYALTNFEASPILENGMSLSAVRGAAKYDQRNHSEPVDELRRKLCQTVRALLKYARGV
jgi:hypothetical protein